MTSYTETTETASIGEGKRNRKTQALSALLSATALGVFLEGCSGADPGASPAPVNGYERIGEDLYFPNANGFNDFSFARTGDNSEDVEITVGGVPETIANFDNDNVLTLYYGSPDTGKELGKLYVGTENRDTLQGNDDVANVMIGLGGDDRLLGGAGDDILYGGAGDDILYGGEGADTLNGGTGEDTASYANARKGVRVDLTLSGVQGDFDGTHDFSANNNEAVGEVLISIENLVGSDYADILTGDGDANRLYGEDDNDFLYGGAGNDFLYGGAGNDYLYGGAGNDELYGGADNDELYGGEGADTIDGGDGIDTASYKSSSKGVRVSLALLEEQVDFDGTHGFLANGNEAVGDVLIGIDHITGSNHNDWLTGDGKDNVLIGKAGNDELNGGDGEDSLYGGAGDDKLYGGADNDTLEGNEDDDELNGGAGNDILSGSMGTDTYVFRVGDGTDFIVDTVGDTMTLRFEGGDYAETDFTSTVFERVANRNDFDLVITLDNDKITIKNAYNDNPNIGTDNAAYTINIEYGEEGGTFTPVTDDVWSGLT